MEENGNGTFDHQDSMKRKPMGGWCPDVASHPEASLRALNQFCGHLKTFFSEGGWDIAGPWREQELQGPP